MPLMPKAVTLPAGKLIHLGEGGNWQRRFINAIGNISNTPVSFVWMLTTNSVGEPSTHVIRCIDGMEVLAETVKVYRKGADYYMQIDNPDDQSVSLVFYGNDTPKAVNLDIDATFTPLSPTFKEFVELNSPEDPFNGDFNTLTANGVYRFAGECTNCPAGATAGGLAIVVCWHSQWGDITAQFATNDQNKWYVRMKWYNMDWRSWAQLT